MVHVQVVRQPAMVKEGLTISRDTSRQGRVRDISGTISCLEVCGDLVMDLGAIGQDEIP